MVGGKSWLEEHPPSVVWREDGAPRGRWARLGVIKGSCSRGCPNSIK